MAHDVKWIKITTDIFDDEKLYALECLPDGQLLELVWLKLLCLAGKCNKNGFLIISDKMPYTIEMMAKIFRMDIGVVQRALEQFQVLDMIEVIDNTYMISNWMKYQNNDKLEKIREQNRIRQQRFRDNQRKLIGKNICQYCGDTATGYDHVIPTSRGGSDSANNKVFCCEKCNQLKMVMPVVDFLNSNRERIKDDLVLANPVLQKHVELVDDKYRNVTDTLQNNVICSYSNSYSFNNTNSNLDNYINLINNNIYNNSEYILNNNKLNNSIKEWMEYKDERKPKSKHHYATEKGMKKLLTEIINKDKEFGTDAVVDAIDKTMAAQYDGIGWYFIKEKPTESEWSKY